MSSKNCIVCDSRCGRSNSVVDVCCFKCKKPAHMECVHLTKEDIEIYKQENKNWYCVNCDKFNKSVRYNDLTPVGPSTPVTTPPTVLHNTVNQSYNTIIQKMEEQQQLISTWMQKTDSKMSILESALTRIELLTVENKQLKSSLAALEIKVQNMEQNERNLFVDIVGVPVSDTPVLDTVLKVLNDGLDAKILPQHIDQCFRVKHKNNESNTKAPVIIVKLIDSNTKRSIFKNKSTRKSFLTTSNLFGTSYKSQIFVNENLITAKRILFSKAANLRKENKFKFLWTKNGKILTRKDKLSPIHVIDCSDDLLKYS